MSPIPRTRSMVIRGTRRQSVCAASSAACEQLERRALLSFAVSFPGGAALTSRADVNASIKAGEEREATVAINPANPRNVIAFSNTVDGTGFDKTWASLDGGLTFTQANIANPAGQTGAGDPALAFDRAGNCYAAHLSSGGGTNVSVAKSTDGGLTWTQPVLVVGAGNTDKEWICVGPNPANLAQDIVYILFRQDVGTDIQLHSIRSLDGGATWGNDVIINDDSAGALNDFATFPDPVVRTSDGALFVVWDDESNNPSFSEVMIDVSLDGGLTWGVDQTVGTTDVTRNNPLRYDIPAQPDREILTVPSLAIAQAGPNAGRVYVAYTIENTAQPNTDIRVARADNIAGPWTNVTVNNVTSNSQFHPWVDTDPMTGEVYVTWYDCRNDTNTGLAGDIDTDNVVNTEVQRFAAASINGGVSYFGNVAISNGISNESTTNPTGHTSDYGDYNTSAAFGGASFAVWPDNSNSTGNNPAGTADKDVYVDRIVTTGHVITVTGTSGDDVYTVGMDASRTYLNIWEGAPVGTPEFIMLEDAVDGIVFNLLAGADMVNLNQIDISMNVTINGGDGNDAMNLGGGDLDANIFSDITFNGDAGTDSVRIDDLTDTGSDSYSVSSVSTGKAGAGAIVYNAIERYVLDANNAANTITVISAFDDFHINGNGGSDQINVQGNQVGTFLFVDGGAGFDTVNVNTDSVGTAAVQFESTQDLSFLHVFPNGTARVNAGGDKLLLTLAFAIDAGGKLDLTDNDMLIDYSGAPSPASTVQSLINTARNGGAWNGATGITSTTAAANPLHNTTLGVLEGTEFDSIYGVGGLFNGVNPDTTAVLIKYTYYGDADFNGVVNFDDYSRTDAGFNFGRTGWLNGDFDGNGVVNFDDYSLIDLAFNTQGIPLITGKRR